MDKEMKELIRELDENNALEYLNDLRGMFLKIMQWDSVWKIIKENAQRIPNDVLLKVWEAWGWDVDDIEKGLKIYGFNDWYKETYGVTVEEASREGRNSP